MKVRDYSSLRFFAMVIKGVVCVDNLNIRCLVFIFRSSSVRMGTVNERKEVSYAQSIFKPRWWC